MTDRDRLIELFNAIEKDPAITCPHYKTDKTCDECKYTINNVMCNHTERTVDYLLANGVILPTLNCGDRVWFIPKGLDEVCEATVVRIEYNYFTSPQEWIVLDYISSIVGKHEYKSRIDLMLGKTVFLTKEEAEEKLNEIKTKE